MGIDGTQSIADGLVIQDAEENEFVWIPVTTDFTKTYSGKTFYSEPIELIYDDIYSNAASDSQTTLNYYYGEGYYNYPETAEEKANVNNTFAYSAHYKEMVESVNKYNGFYIGRYETTIDGSNVGSKAGLEVLTTGHNIVQTNNEVCLWWGLYAVQRDANVAENGNVVQTNMIWGQQWDAMLAFLDNQNKDYSTTSVKTLATSGLQGAGQAKYTYNSEEISDEMCNIFDLRGNLCEFTGEASITLRARTVRGGDYVNRTTASFRTMMWPRHTGGFEDLVDNCSRLALYIK